MDHLGKIGIRLLLFAVAALNTSNGRSCDRLDAALDYREFSNKTVTQVLNPRKPIDLLRLSHIPDAKTLDTWLQTTKGHETEGREHCDEDVTPTLPAVQALTILSSKLDQGLDFLGCFATLTELSFFDCNLPRDLKLTEHP